MREGGSSHASIGAAREGSEVASNADGELAGTEEDSEETSAGSIGVPVPPVRMIRIAAWTEEERIDAPRRRSRLRAAMIAEAPLLSPLWVCCDESSIGHSTLEASIIRAADAVVEADGSALLGVAASGVGGGSSP